LSAKSEDANLILKLYELRREEVMRRARDWYTRQFNPETVQDVINAATGEHSAYYRMVTSYWEMAAALVNNDGIDEKMFNDTNGEHILVYSKIEPFIEELRQISGYPYMFQHLEGLIARMPDGKERIARTRELLKRMQRVQKEEERIANASPGGEA
jgi:hypothetical protein